MVIKMATTSNNNNYTEQAYFKTIGKQDLFSQQMNKYLGR